MMEDNEKDYGIISKKILEIVDSKNSSNGEESLSKAYAEIYDVISHFEEDMYSKIPKKFLNMIEEKMDKTYVVNIDYSNNIKNQISDKAKAILSLIYRDYICLGDEKNFLIEYDKMKLENS